MPRVSCVPVTNAGPTGSAEQGGGIPSDRYADPKLWLPWCITDSKPKKTPVLMNDRTIGWVKPEGRVWPSISNIPNSETPDGYIKVVELYPRMLDGGGLLNPAGCRFTAEHKGFSK